MRTKRILRQALVVSTVIAALATTRSSRAQGCSVTAHFGWIVPNPITTQVYWPNARSDAFSLAGDWIDELTDPQFYSPVTEYNIKTGTYGGIYWPTGLTHGGTLTDTQIQDGLVTTLQEERTVPRSGEVYLIFLPSDTTAQMDSAPGEYGYHAWAQRQLWDGNTYVLVYGVVEDTDLQTTTISGSHELYEAFTDPLPIPTGDGHIQCMGYGDSDNNEVADKCKSMFGGFWQSDYGFSLAQVYSQNFCRCLPRAF